MLIIRKYILALGKGPTQELDDTWFKAERKISTAEKQYFKNLLGNKRNFVQVCIILGE